MSKSVKSIVNRYGQKLTIGAPVRMSHPRGGHEYGTIRAFETTGEFVRAYGKRAILSSGMSGGIDDCALASLPSLLARNPSVHTETLRTGAIAVYTMDRLSYDEKWELHHLADFVVSSISSDVAILCPR